MPGNSGSQVRLLIEEKLSKVKGLNFQITDILYVPAIEVDPKEELVVRLGATAKEVMKKEPMKRGVGPWNDAWMYVAADIPAIGGFGPDGGGVHQKGEWISLPSLKQITEIYAKLAIQYLGIKKKKMEEKPVLSSSD
jgi:acetylornithine deacetylase/succinyl-diaminopimelate desuccinylase-like protein